MTQQNELLHYGVKGMKWGKRKARDDSSGGGGAKTAAPAKRMSRKEVRKLNKVESQKFYEKKAETIFKEAAKKGDNVLIKVLTPGQLYPQVSTGKEFTDYLARGGMMDIRMTEIYAEKKGSGPFETKDAIGQYQKIKR